MSRGAGLPTRILAVLCAAAAFGAAQTPRPATRPASRPTTSAAPTAALRAAVEAYFDARTDAEAEDLLAPLLARADATDDALLAAVTEPPVTPPAPIGGFDDLVPYRDQFLGVRYAVPPDRPQDGPRLPVVFDLAGRARDPQSPTSAGILYVRIPDYTPPEFSDEGRDGFLKTLRRATHRLRGDPDRLWFTGFSWAGHASCDVPLHRPHWLRGVVPVGGGPRRVHFRLFANLRGAIVRFMCGDGDDPELVWNLKETVRVAHTAGFEASLDLATNMGHDARLVEADILADVFRDVAALSEAENLKRLAAPIYADGPGVETPLVRLDVVDAKRVVVPDRVPVDATLGYDEKRRRTIAAYAKSVVVLRPTITTTTDKSGVASTLLAFASDGVREAVVRLRAPFAPAGRRVVVRAKGVDAWSGVVAVDRPTLLREARRTGERLRPALRTVRLVF